MNHNLTIFVGNCNGFYFFTLDKFVKKKFVVTLLRFRNEILHWFNSVHTSEGILSYHWYKIFIPSNEKEMDIIVSLKIYSMS